MIFCNCCSRIILFGFLFCLSFHTSAQDENLTPKFEDLMQDVIAEMNLSDEEQEEAIYAGVAGLKLRDWVRLKDFTWVPMMIEVNRFLSLPPTNEQTIKANEVYRLTLLNIIEKKWYLEEEAVKAGYRLDPKFDPVHYPNEEFLNDGEVVNPERPEILMFYPTPWGRMLLGVMFYVEDQLDAGPQFGGSSTIWHFHIQPKTCWINGIRVGLTPNRTCEKGLYSNRSPEMIHIWFVNHPEGRFGSTMGMAFSEAEAIKVRDLYKHYK